MGWEIDATLSIPPAATRWSYSACAQTWRRLRHVIVEHVAGAAIEQLRFSPERYWAELRIALPKTAGPARFDQRADATQIGAVALALLLGRPLHEDEYPGRVTELVASTWAVSA